MEKSYTPCTCGATNVQLEFDFGPEFTQETSDTCDECNSQQVEVENTCKACGFIEFKEVKNEN